MPNPRLPVLRSAAGISEKGRHSISKVPGSGAAPDPARKDDEELRRQLGIYKREWRELIDRVKLSPHFRSAPDKCQLLDWLWARFPAKVTDADIETGFFIWDKIDADLAKNEVPTAAARLRRHLEYVASDLADELGAKVHYRADGGYDMGELLSAVIGRQGELLKQAARAAKSWGDDAQLAAVVAFQEVRSKILAERNGEEWIINKAVHYNEWADLTKNDFRPVVSAFRHLLEQFRCSKAQCDSWLSLSPRLNATDLRCGCGTLRFNLKEK